MFANTRFNWFKSDYTERNGTERNETEKNGTKQHKNTQKLNMKLRPNRILR